MAVSSPDVSDPTGAALSAAFNRIQTLRDKNTPAILDEAFRSIVELSAYSREWAVDLARDLGRVSVVLGDFGDEEGRPVTLWVHEEGIEAAPRRRDGYVTDGVKHTILDVVSVGAQGVDRFERHRADINWHQGGVASNFLNADGRGMKLFVPEPGVSLELAEEALRRHFHLSLPSQRELSGL